MKTSYPPEWRTQSKWKRRFYSKYMRWLEIAGYVTVIAVIGAFIFAYNYRVDDVIAADRVPLRATSVPIVVNQPTWTIRQLQPNFAEVKSGDPILEVVTGEGDYQRYLAHQALNKLSIDAPFPKPPTTLIRASVAGTLYVDPASIGTAKFANQELAQIRDYSHLVASASLTGPGVARAKAQGQAIVRSIVVEPQHGILVRGRSEGESVISSRLGDEALYQNVAKHLNGARFEVRDDVDLQFRELSELQIDALLTATTTAESDRGLWLEPSATIALTAEVTRGEHRAQLQFALLPPQLRDRIHAEIERSLQKPVRTINGDSKSIEAATDINTVMKVKATPSSGPPGSVVIPATAVSRSFEAELKINNPPSYLSEAVRAADRAGKQVTAKVELKTGDRPIASILLKRS